MPVALERKLNKQAKRKGLKKKSKDAYVYGTLRKTGWKPKREMTAMDKKITYLQDINKKLDTYFQYENEDEKKNKNVGSALRATALAGTAGTGLYGAGAMKGQGLTIGQTFDKAHQNLTSIGRGGAGDAWSAVKQGAGVVKSTGASAWEKIMAIVKNKIPKFEAGGKEIQFWSPMSDFNQSHKEIMREKMDAFRKAKDRKKDARRALEDADFGLTKKHDVLRDKLHRESYVARGAGIGGITGAALGGTLGAFQGASRSGGKIGAALLGGFGLLTGGMIGAGTGSEIGGRIRRKRPLRKTDMSSRCQKLIELNSKIDCIVNLEAPEEFKKKAHGILDKALVIGGLGYGGYKANQLVQYGGGYKKVGKDLLDAAKRGFRK